MGETSKGRVTFHTAVVGGKGASKDPSFALSKNGAVQEDTRRTLTELKSVSTPQRRPSEAVRGAKRLKHQTILRGVKGK